MDRRKLKSNIKLVLFITALILVFVIFIILNNMPRSYEMAYSVSNVEIIEKYDNDAKYYTFNIKYKDIDTNIYALTKYQKSRHLIQAVSKTENEDSICLEFNAKDINLYSICHNKDGYYSSYLDNEEEFIENDSYNNILIDSLSNYTYLLWNYNGFIYLNSNKKYNIDLFNKDTYNINLYYQYNDYLLIPDYSQEFIFNKMYLINTSNGKVTSHDLRFPVYFDSYFLGKYQGSVYIYDRKEEQEYYFDIKKGEINKTSNKIYKDNKWEKVSTQKLKNKEVTFSNSKIFDYYLDDGTLYTNSNMKVSNRIVDKIIKVDNLNVFYLSKGVLYIFNPLSGEKPLLKYSEWEFNNQNMVFVF